jgi:hypothetical protein
MIGKIALGPEVGWQGRAGGKSSHKGTKVTKNSLFRSLPSVSFLIFAATSLFLRGGVPEFFEK